MDYPVVQGCEARIQSLAYAPSFLAVLTVIHTERDGATRVINVRSASNNEHEVMMPDSKTHTMSRNEVLTTVHAIPPESDSISDDKDENDLTATVEEQAAAITSRRSKRGRKAGSGKKEQVAIRLDRDILSIFRASGTGWQTRMNAALRNWLKTHSPV